jgi:Flp pilus assembly protein TadD
MRGLLVRFAGIALCATALTGCGMMGGGDDAVTPPSAHNGGGMPLPTDMAAAVRQAQLLRTSGDLEGATRILSQLMLGAPDDPRVVGEYGKLLVQEGHSGDAVQFLRRAIELQPSDWTLYSALGVAYDQQTDPANAKMAYERALGLKPGEAAVLNNFAMSRMLAGDRVAARTLMMQAQASGSTDPKIAQNLALLDSTTPAAPPAPPPSAVAMAPTKPVVASNAFPLPAPAAAHGAPLPIAHGSGQVVMQEVPIDPLAGPVGHAAHNAKPPKLAKTGKPAKVALAGKPTAKAKPAPRTLAANTPPKPVKPAKPSAHDHIPALRMTADASKP